MPVYRRSYRNYEGTLRRHFRWAIVTEQELRVLSKSRVFMAFCLMGLLHAIMRLMQIVAYDVIMQNPNNPLTPMLVHVSAIIVRETTFFDFVRIQSSLVFVATLYAGAGMICNDFRHNLMPVYFAKPIRWYDYALGKFFALTTVGILLTAVPGVILVVLHNILAPSWDLLATSYWWPASIIAFSLTVVLPCACGVLASSAVLGSQNFAAVAVVMLVVADSAMGAILSHALHWPSLFLLSFPLSINRIGESQFLQSSVMFDAPIIWPAFFWTSICAVSVWCVVRRVRSAEAAG